MRRGVVVALLVGAWAVAGLATADERKDEKRARVRVLDDCDPAATRDVRRGSPRTAEPEDEESSTSHRGH
jgi:hypothetical protein